MVPCPFSNTSLNSFSFYTTYLLAFTCFQSLRVAQMEPWTDQPENLTSFLSVGRHLDSDQTIAPTVLILFVSS